MFDILMSQSLFFNGKGGTLGLKRVETFEKIINTHWHKVLLLCKIIFPHNRYEIKGWTPNGFSSCLKNV
jgi:hypothetical protein